MRKTKMTGLSFLIVIALVVVNAQYNQGILSTIDSKTFVDEVESRICGMLTQTEMGNIAQVISCGSGFTAIQGYTMHTQRDDTSLMFVFSIRDATKMPRATLTDLYNTVLGGTAASSVTNVITIKEGNRQGGGANTTQCVYVSGGLDSYGNMISDGDLMYLDWGLIFSAPVDNQQATINAWANSETFTWF